MKDQLHNNNNNIQINLYKLFNIFVIISCLIIVVMCNIVVGVVIHL